MLQGNKGEVDHLNSWPEHPVGFQCCPSSLLDAFLSTLTFHGSHAAKEDTDHDMRKAKLVTGNTSEDFSLFVSHIDIASEEGKPGYCHRSENAY